MTLTPCFLALAMIAEPLPLSRLTSNSTFAPLVMACSACVRWAAGSPSALTIVASTPAFLKAFSKNGRSWPSQRADDLESGSRTATLPALAPPPVLAPVSVLLSLLLPHPAATSEPAAITATGTANQCLNLISEYLSLWRNLVPP